MILLLRNGLSSEQVAAEGTDDVLGIAEHCPRLARVDLELISQAGRVFCSPALRSRQTAARLGLAGRLEIREELRQRNYGQLAGEPQWSARRRVSGRDGKDPWKAVDGIEPVVAVAERLTPLALELVELERSLPESPPLVISHGDVLQILQSVLNTPEVKVDARVLRTHSGYSLAPGTLRRFSRSL